MFRFFRRMAGGVRVVVVLGLVMGMACGASIPAGAVASPVAAPAAVMVAPMSAGWAKSVPAGRSVFLVTGEQVSLAGGLGGMYVMTREPGSEAEPAGPLQTLSQGGTTRVMPVTAAPYLGRGLAAALFEPKALARAESAGRLPVRISYSGDLRSLPGVTVTSSRDGTAAGYLTAAGARAFGSALARQYAADHARASYGQDGILRGVEITLAGTAASAPPVRPAFPMHTLVVSGTNLAGRPDTGDEIEVFNVDDPFRLGSDAAAVGFFDHGAARFSVPAGHYWAVADFCCGRGFSSRIVVVPQFSVSRAAPTSTLHVSERSATSRIAITTPRPAKVQDVVFNLLRLNARGGGVFDSEDVPENTWVSPTTARPTAGTLQSDTQATFTSPSSATGAPYAYLLDFPGRRGIVPAQHFRPRAASLATIRERYFQGAKSAGSWCTVGGFVYPDGAFDFTCLGLPLKFPHDQTQYLSAGRSVVWQFFYSSPAGGQADAYRSYRPGEHLTVNWGEYPLHPQPQTQPLRGRLAADPSLQQQLPSAVRVGNTIRLGDTFRMDGFVFSELPVTAFSDNTPGHLGPGVTGGGAGSYAVYRDGVRVAHGNPAGGIRPVKVTGRRSVIRFTLTAWRRRSLDRLSPTSTTTWTWHTRRRPAARVPVGWNCSLSLPVTRRCAVQQMMTLDYHVRGLALNGTAAAGPQVIGVDAGHIQLGGHARITQVTAQVSFTGGRSWRRATVTALGHGHFRVSFTAPSGAYVTLRTTAADAAGGSVTETIHRAYQITSRPAKGATR